MIASAFESSPGNVSAARSIYVALTEIRSDKQREKFDVSQSEIASRAGVSVSTTRRILPILKQLGLITIQRNSVHGVEVQSTYEVVQGPLVHGERAPVHPPQSG